MTKVCKGKCKLEKRLREFSWLLHSVDSRKAVCKQCVSEAGKEYRLKVKERKRLEKEGVK